MFWDKRTLNSTRNSLWHSKAKLFSPTFEPPIAITIPELSRTTLYLGWNTSCYQGKLGDPEDFLDMNILPNFDGIRILYHDWIISKERKIASNTRVFWLLSRISVLNVCPSELYLSLDRVPFSDVTNSSTTKRRAPRADDSTPVKRRRCNANFTSSRTPKRTYSIQYEHSVILDDSEGFPNVEDVDFGSDTPPRGMDENEIQRLMNILEDTIEHVEDSTEFRSVFSFSDQLSPDSGAVFELAQDCDSLSDVLSEPRFFPFFHSSRPSTLEPAATTPYLSRYSTPYFSRRSSPPSSVSSYSSFSSVFDISSSTSSSSSSISSISSSLSDLSIYDSSSLDAATACTIIAEGLHREHGVENCNSVQEMFPRIANYHLDPFSAVHG
ncbi:hypothetical protein BT96DRAFT_1021160 [Gymnopus androsaceus JB14]|uniref:Uncharacterized protein n=1 Tax=Gymnopus androsaceus JB14 TaxID=1447944 RepID=A0A6A4HGM1_9AGAR|nr:hypothetical protein BT96DRAFT_1021160 [Gymnopus androsaceus JB14]